jgi:hypothetical protein
VRHKTNHLEKNSGNESYAEKGKPTLVGSFTRFKSSERSPISGAVCEWINLQRCVFGPIRKTRFYTNPSQKLIIPSNHKSLNICLPPSPLPSPKRIQHDLRQGDKGSRTATHSAWVVTVHASGALMQTLTYIMDVKVIKNKL